jgi:hypothetical protein
MMNAKSISTNRIYRSIRLAACRNAGPRGG